MQTGMRAAAGAARVGFAVFLALTLPGALAVSAARAEGLVLPTTQRPAKGARAALLTQQLAVLDTRAAVEYGGKRGGGSGAVPSYTGRYKGELLDKAREVARANGIPEDLFLRLVQRESGWNTGAVSPKGATGLAQLMPETADHLGVDETDPHQNLEGGARYLRQMYDRFGDWRLALAAYNAGPEAVERYGGIPPFAETTAYVRGIMGS